jgi:hypothetical protein
LRWYLRGFLWLRFLWQVSRLNLRLVPTHPDRTGGLGFLVRSTEAFTPILLAQGVMLAGLIASRIFHAGQELKEFKAQPPSSRFRRRHAPPVHAATRAREAPGLG